MRCIVNFLEKGQARDCFSYAAFVLKSRVDSLKDLNLAQEDDIKVLRMKVQQVEDDYEAVRTELDDVK